MLSALCITSVSLPQPTRHLCDKEEVMMKYESPVMELVSAPEDTIMTSGSKMNVVDLWDMLIEGA